MQVAEITFPQLVSVAAILLAIIGAYNAIMTAIKNHRDEKTMKSKPIEDIKAKLEAHDKMLARDKERLDDMEELHTVLLRSIKSILSHEVNGNSVDKMKQSVQEIDDYLIRRK
jgi:hypothetical protein